VNRVAFFGAYDPDYPRVRVFREAFGARGVEVRDIAAPRRRWPMSGELGLLAAWIRRSAGVDAIVVPAFGHRDVWLASLLARPSKVPVLFDPLVSRWDTQVRDLGRVRVRSLGAARLRASDRLAFALADMVLCDTWEHGDFYSAAFRVPRRKLCRIPVGADARAFELGAARSKDPKPGPLDVVYVGGYLPLHGLPAILDAAERLEARHGARFATFTLIGSGMMRPRVERDVAARGLRSVRLLSRTPYGDALARLARADVALGIFGTSEKAGRVVPHKVFQAMALGVATVTRRSTAISEFFRDSEHLALVAPGDGGALAGAIEALAADPERRARIAESGRQSVRAQASPQRIGDLLVEAVARALEATAPHGRR
jgi:glycosyltransferase involved in cell wall biosynthesis